MAIYLSGDGTQVNPYLIHTADALFDFMTTKTGAYGELICDINMSGKSFGTSWVTVGFALLSGNGFAINDLYLGNTLFRCTINKTKIYLKQSCVFAFGASSVLAKFNDVEIKSDAGITLQIIVNQSGAHVLTRCLIYVPTLTLPASGITYVTCYANAAKTGITTISVNSFDASIYSALTDYPAVWIVDGSSLPRLNHQSVSSLTQVYVIKGTTKVGGVAKSRKCRAHSQVDFYLINSVISNTDGSYLLNCGYYTDHVYVTHSDDYGYMLAASKSYVLGNYVHPNTPNGYRYKCTTPGTSGAELPPVPWPTSSNLVTGTAIFTPEPVYKTETFLVVPVLYDLLTGQPV